MPTAADITDFPCALVCAVVSVVHVVLFLAYYCNPCNPCIIRNCQTRSGVSSACARS